MKFDIEVIGEAFCAPHHVGGVGEIGERVRTRGCEFG